MVRGATDLHLITKNGTSFLVFTERVRIGDWTYSLAVQSLGSSLSQTPIPSSGLSPLGPKKKPYTSVAGATGRPLCAENDSVPVARCPSAANAFRCCVARGSAGPRAVSGSQGRACIGTIQDPDHLGRSLAAQPAAHSPNTYRVDAINASPLAQGTAWLLTTADLLAAVVFTL